MRKRHGVGPQTVTAAARHFLAIAAREMRRTLVDGARARKPSEAGWRLKNQVEFHDIDQPVEKLRHSVVQFEDDLERLRAIGERKA